MSAKYNRTRRACYISSFTQAIVCNLAPLLFITFQNHFGLNFERLGRLILMNFITQIIVDIICVKYADKVGYRLAGIISNVFCATGLVCLGILPEIMPSAYVGLCISVVIYSIGGGIIEVIASPVLEALPSDKKAGDMSFLHSFYSLGQIIVTLVTTSIIKIFGYDIWFLIPVLWAVIPVINAVNFSRVPLLPIIVESEKGTPLREILKSKVFITALIVMICSGAAEITMSQWASLFAEKGLGVNKFTGDLMGPCLFAVFMYIGRTLYSKYSDKIRLEKLLIISASACVFCYLLAVFSPLAIFSLLGCALCGLTVSIMWPGTLSLSARQFPKGGTAMFGMLAIFGDIGCSVGPWVSGIVSDAVQKSQKLVSLGSSYGIAAEQLGMKCGLFFGVFAPILLIVGMMVMHKIKKSQNKKLL